MFLSYILLINVYIPFRELSYLFLWYNLTLFILINNYIYRKTILHWSIQFLLDCRSIYWIKYLSASDVLGKNLLIRERKTSKIVACIMMADNEGRQIRQASDKFEKQTFPFPDRGPLITLRMIFCFLYLLQSKLQPSSIPFDSLGKPHHIAIHPLVSRSPCLPY